MKLIHDSSLDEITTALTGEILIFGIGVGIGCPLLNVWVAIKVPDPALYHFIGVTMLDMLIASFTALLFSATFTLDAYIKLKVKPSKIVRIMQNYSGRYTLEYRRFGTWFLWGASFTTPEEALMSYKDACRRAIPKNDTYVVYRNKIDY